MITIFIKFKVRGLLSGREIKAIKSKMTTITNRLLFRLEETIKGMKVLSMEVGEF